MKRAPCPDCYVCPDHLVHSRTYNTEYVRRMRWRAKHGKTPMPPFVPVAQRPADTKGKAKAKAKRTALQLIEERRRALTGK